jgi:hypothetical protein
MQCNNYRRFAGRHQTVGICQSAWRNISESLNLLLKLLLLLLLPPIPHKILSSVCDTQYLIFLCVRGTSASYGTIYLFMIFLKTLWMYPCRVDSSIHTMNSSANIDCRRLVQYMKPEKILSKSSLLKFSFYLSYIWSFLWYALWLLYYIVSKLKKIQLTISCNWKVEKSIILRWY